MQFEEAVMYALWGSAIVLVIGVIYKYTRKPNFVPTITTTDPDYNKLMAYYIEENPQKATKEHVLKILGKYYGHREVLFERLAKKYSNDEPTPTPPAPALAVTTQEWQQRAQQRSSRTTVPGSTLLRRAGGGQQSGAKVEEMLQAFATDLSEGGEATLRNTADGSEIKVYMAGGKKFKVERSQGGTKDVLSIANSQDEAIQVLRQQPGLSKCIAV